MNAHTRAEALRLVDQIRRDVTWLCGDPGEHAAANCEKLRALLSASDDVPGEIGALTTKLAAMQTSLDSDVAEALIEGWDELFDAAPAAANGWRTMESAPMNGTSILVCGGTMCRTSDMDGLEWPTQGVHIAFRQGGIEPFWNAGDASAHDEYYVIKPTYWQPLPMPPNGETK